MNCVWCEDEPGGCTVCRATEKAPEPPKERKLTPAQQAKRARLAAPAARSRRRPDPTIEAIRTLAAGGLLAPEELRKYSEVIEPTIPATSAAVFRKWRRDHGLS